MISICVSRLYCPTPQQLHWPLAGSHEISSPEYAYRTSTTTTTSSSSSSSSSSYLLPYQSICCVRIWVIVHLTQVLPIISSTPRVGNNPEKLAGWTNMETAASTSGVTPGQVWFPISEFAELLRHIFLHLDVFEPCRKTATSDWVTVKLADCREFSHTCSTSAGHC